MTALIWLAGLRIFDTRNLLVVAPFAAMCLAALVAAIPLRPLPTRRAQCWRGSPCGPTPSTATSHARPTTRSQPSSWSSAGPRSLRSSHARYPQTRPLSWHLPGHPYVRVSQPGPGRCEHAFVVAEDPEARAWLATHADLIEEQREFPWYGSQLASERETPDVAVARLTGSPELLADAVADGAFLLQVRGRRQAPCLEPKTASP